MTDGKRHGPQGEGASPRTRAWVAERDEMRAAAAADRERAAQARAEEHRQLEREYHNPLGFVLGLLVLALLLAGVWFIVDRMRCDPFYSDGGLAQRKSCRPDVDL